MTPPLLIAPDGARALAALLAGDADDALRTGPLTPALAALIAEAKDAGGSQAALAAVYTRRRQHLPSTIAGRAPAARFLRRHFRRWRVTQSMDFTEHFPAESLARAGRRAQRRGVGWPEADALSVGAWHAFWAITDARQRRDLLALLPLTDAQRIAQTPLDRVDAQRFWR